MRLIKITGGLGNQMFIYAFYLQMKKRFPDTQLDLSDMVHYKVHHGYEMHRVFNLPKIEFCINQILKKVVEFLFFKTVLERKQNGSMEAYQKDTIGHLSTSKDSTNQKDILATLVMKFDQPFPLI